MPFLLPTPHGYYFRIVVPSDLRQTIGKREIKKSLRTYDPKSAKLQASQYANRYHFLFRVLRGEEKIMSFDDFYNKSSRLILKKCEFLADGTVKLEGLEQDPRYPEAEEKLLNNIINNGKRRLINETTSEINKNFHKETKKLSELINEYCDSKIASDEWVKGTINENTSCLNMFLDIVGDIDIKEINTSHSHRFISILKIIEPRRINLDELKELSIEELKKRYKSPILSPTTINTACGKISSLFIYALEKHYIDVNYFSNLKIKDMRPVHEARSIFSDEHLCKLFSSKIYTENVWKHPHYYWVPLIALYSGMRMEEICQLHASDIIMKDGLWTFDVNAREGKTLKSASSWRFIPIHKNLINLGLLDYVDLINSRGETRLFYYLKKAGDKYGRKVSDWFRSYRKKVGVDSVDGKLVFHSFRHTVINFFKQSQVSIEIMNAISGHSEDRIGMSRYGKPYDMNTLSPYIEMISFPKENEIIKFDVNKVVNYKSS